MIKDSVLEDNMWVANSLYKAFEAAKAQVCRGLNQTGANKTILPWAFRELEETRALMGEDFWPYGIEKIRRAIETFSAFAYEQGLTSRRLTVEELFVPTTHEDYYVSSQEAY